MTTNTITARQYFQNVLDAHLSDEMDALSAKYIAGLDARNEKRKSADSKEKQAARARRESVLDFLTEHKGESFTRDQIAEAVGISGAAVSSACKALGELVAKSEIKVDKARKVAYSKA
jgi:CRP-like cAMP-binding protein